MLPPFVPPAARVSSETLPLITEFVVDRIEHSFESSFNLSAGSGAVATATLPSIDEFVLHEPESAQHADDEFMQRTSRSPWGTYEAEHEVDRGTPLPATPAAALEPDLLPIDDHHAPSSGSQEAIVNETAERADAWAATAGSGSEATASKTPGAVSDAPPAHPSPVAPEVWVSEERDAFDWHAVANLTVPPAEEQRAAEEWSSTEWDRSSGSMQDHIAAQLAQVSRRVRSGELEVRGSKQMGPEAALVAALAALLSEQGRK
ncbi:MAG TPA: hypothetical protein VN602_09175 [Gemmatimonadaceae bacterium]|nr:hypothetical protein [Gemmatimonadaceae bacterium]